MSKINIKGSKRLNNEEFVDYKKRLKEEKTKIKYWLICGNKIWDSQNGQYIVKEGAIKNTLIREEPRTKREHHNYFCKKYHNDRSRYRNDPRTYQKVS